MDFADYWQHTDQVTQSIFFLLMFLSIISWLVGILKVIHSFRTRNKVLNGIHDAIESKKISDQNVSIEDRKTITEQLLLQRIARYRYQGEFGLSVLGTTASIAPFLGLFGTVWSIFHALHNIGNTGQAGLDQVAGPVGEALIMTGLGIAVAIPAVIFYNIIVRLNRRVLFKANDIAYSILTDVVEKNSQSNYSANAGYSANVGTLNHSSDASV